MATYPDGTDFSTFWMPDGSADMDPNFTPIPGSRAVMERVLRRWMANPGDYDNDTFGYSVFQYYNANILPRDLEVLAAGMRDQALLEEGVDDCYIEAMIMRNGTVRLKADFYLKDLTTWETVFVLSEDTLPRITLLGPG